MGNLEDKLRLLSLQVDYSDGRTNERYTLVHARVCQGKGDFWEGGGGGGGFGARGLEEEVEERTNDIFYLIFSM